MDQRAHLDETPPPSAAEALAIIRQEQAKAGRSLNPSLPALLGAWGLAWLAIGLGYWSAATGRITVLEAFVCLVVALLFATVVSVAVIVGSGRGVRGVSDRQSRRYGLSWVIGTVGAGALAGGLVRAGLPPDVQPLAYSGMFVLVAGLLYLAGATIWNNAVQYLLGAWTVLVAVASVYAGTPAGYLVIGMGGGGGLLVAAAVQHRRARQCP